MVAEHGLFELGTVRLWIVKPRAFGTLACASDLFWDADGDPHDLLA